VCYITGAKYIKTFITAVYCIADIVMEQHVITGVYALNCIKGILTGADE